LLFRDYLVLFEKLVKQHRVDLRIAHGFGLAFGIASHQIGIRFGYFLCDETKGYGLGGVILLMIPEAHWSERVDRFTSVVHRSDVVFIPARRDIRPAKSAFAVYGNVIWIRSDRRLNIGINLTDIVAVTHVLTKGADSNYLIRDTDGAASEDAQANITIAGAVVSQRISADRRVAEAFGVVNKRSITNGPVDATFCVVKRARSPLAVLKLPSSPLGRLGLAPGPVLLKSANAPVAVFRMPVELLRALPVPTAVFSSAMFLKSVPAGRARTRGTTGSCWGSG
jgi:hypothetical protein